MVVIKTFISIYKFRLAFDKMGHLHALKHAYYVTKVRHFYGKP